MLLLLLLLAHSTACRLPLQPTGGRDHSDRPYLLRGFRAMVACHHLPLSTL